MPTCHPVYQPRTLFATITILLALVANVFAADSPPSRTVLGIDGTQFTLNGRPEFLLGASFYGGLGASDEVRGADLDKLKQQGFNWVRVWVTWAAFGADLSAVEPTTGAARQPYLNRLEELVAECDRRGMIVDVTLSRGRSDSGPPRLPTHEAHRRAVRTIVEDLKPFRNWYLDLSNERNIGDSRYTPIDELRELRELVRHLIYHLDEALTFGPEDSGTQQAPVTYVAAAGETVVLSGGRRLTSGRWGEIRGHRAWIVDIPAVKQDDWRFRQLFVNGTRRPRTRIPSQGEYRIESLPGYTGDFLRSPTKQFVYAAGDIEPTWRNLRDVEIVAITRWQDNRLPIESVDATTRTVTFDRPSLFALLANDRPGPYWVENVFEALGRPGQWYLDRSSGLLICLPLPGEDLSTAEIVAPRLERLLTVVGRPGNPVHDLHFEGLLFAHAEWQPPADYASSLQAGIEVPGAILFNFAERCSLVGGGIEHIGNYGVEVNVGCQDVEISHNRITDVGAGGIRVGHFFSWETDGSGQLTKRGAERKAAMPEGPHSRRITVADNDIAHCGRITPEAVGIFVGDNAENKVIHNHIFDVFYSGISVGSVQNFGPCEATANLIEYNHLHDIGQSMLSDLGAIYTCSTRESLVRYNVIHGVSRRDYGGWEIYLDEGSHDVVVEKNLVFHCQDGALFVHHARNIRSDNNIFALNRVAQVDRGGIGGFELSCRRNLIYYREGKAIGDYGGANSGHNVCAFDQNVYWNCLGSA